MNFIFYNNGLNPTLQKDIFTICRRLTHNKKNHYEVLNLKNSCTSKEIKQAYIVLSKKYHPDLNKTYNTKKFLEVSEAYNILSKPDTRRDYDLSIRPSFTGEASDYYEYKDAKSRNPMDDPSFYQNRDRRQDHFYEQKPYYGIKGIPRMSNSRILMACIIFMAIGVSLQVLAIRHSFTLKRDQLLMKSAEANSNLTESRNAAVLNGNKMQIAILEAKFRHSNSTYDK